MRDDVEETRPECRVPDRRACRPPAPRWAATAFMALGLALWRFLLRPLPGPTSPRDRPARRVLDASELPAESAVPEGLWLQVARPRAASGLGFAYGGRVARLPVSGHFELVEHFVESGGARHLARIRYRAEGRRDRMCGAEAPWAVDGMEFCVPAERYLRFPPRRPAGGRRP